MSPIEFVSAYCRSPTLPMIFFASALPKLKPGHPDEAKVAFSRMLRELDNGGEGLSLFRCLDVGDAWSIHSCPPSGYAEPLYSGGNIQVIGDTSPNQLWFEHEEAILGGKYSRRFNKDSNKWEWMEPDEDEVVCISALQANRKCPLPICRFAKR